MGLLDKIQTSIPTFGTKSGLLSNGLASGPKFSPTGGGGFLSKLDPAMKMDLGLAGIDLLGSLAMGIQSRTAKKPEVFRTTAPRLETPQLENGTAEAQSMIKENLGTQTNTILNNAMESGLSVNEVGPGIFANANRVMKEGSLAISKENRDINNQQSIINTETENKNKIGAYEAEKDYQTRKADVLGKDALMRGQQMSMAVQNIGSIGSRLLNDFMLTDLIKKGNESDNLWSKVATIKNM